MRRAVASSCAQLRDRVVEQRPSAGFRDSAHLMQGPCKRSDVKSVVFSNFSQARYVVFAALATIGVRNRSACDFQATMRQKNLVFTQLLRRPPVVGKFKGKALDRLPNIRGRVDVRHENAE